MKTVMKKLLSLALVAILLVSAVPFQASADETAYIDVPVTVYVKGVNTATKHIRVYQGTDVTLTAELGMSLLRDKDNRSFDKWVASDDGPLNYEWLEKNLDNYTLDLYINETTVHTHEYKEVVTKKATCTETGLITYTCDCGATNGTREIPLIEHNLSDPALNQTTGMNEQHCLNTGCTYSKTWKADDTTLITFIAGDQTFTRNWKANTSVNDVPTYPTKTGYEFKGWFSGKNGTGDRIQSGDTWYGNHTTYYAYYIKSTNDGMSTLSVYARFYVGGIPKGQTQLLYTQDFKDGDAMLSWLNKNQTKTSDAIFALVDAEDYDWSPRYYYSYSGNEPLEDQDLIADGDKSVVVKVYGKDSINANVLLYVHQYNTKTKSYDLKSIHEMNGYTVGSTVTKSAAVTIVKNNYTGKNMTVTGLYSDTSWNQLMAGQNPTAANGVTVSNSTITKVHVILKNGTAGTGSTSTADSTNPKTGDMIFVPMMVMVASAAAVAFVYFGSKKRSVR